MGKRLFAPIFGWKIVCKHNEIEFSLLQLKIDKKQLTDHITIISHQVSLKDCITGAAV